MVRYVTQNAKGTFLFPRHGRDVVVLHVAIIGASYILTIALYLHSSKTNTPLGSGEELAVFIVLSLVLSGFALLQKTTFGAIVTLIFRCYLIMVYGYSVEATLSIKLLLGIAVLCEAAIIPERPFNTIFSVLCIAVLLVSEVYNPLLGHRAHTLQAVTALSPSLVTMGFIFGAFSAAATTLVRKSDKQEEIRRDFQLHKASMQALADFNADLQAYARTIDLESSARERNRISREIHDISGYIFTNLIALLNAACSLPAEDREGLSDILITARKQAHQGLKETRIALHKTREVSFPEEEGVRAIHSIIAIFEKVTGVEVTVFWGNAPNLFPRALNLALYRTVQEALTNAIRHGLATQIMIQFSECDGILSMVIRDNGQGAQSVVKGIGIAGMEERLSALGGTVRVTSAPEGGFVLRVRVPIIAPPPPREAVDAGILPLCPPCDQ